MSFVTFIIPTINRDSLQHAVDSLFAQTDQDWSAIIVGDGMTPEVGFGEEKITIGAGPQIGSAGVTRNVGLQVYEMQSKSSEWMAFLDDDDRVTPQYVEHLREHAEDYPWADVIVFRMNHPQLGILPPPTGELRQGTVGISFAMRTSLLDDHAFVAEDVSQLFHEDWQMIAEFQENGRRIFISPHIDYLVRDAY